MGRKAYKKTGLHISSLGEAEYHRRYYHLRIKDHSRPDGRVRTEDIRVTRWASLALKNLKKSAVVRVIPWDKAVDSAWLRAQFDRQQGRCFYTGIPFEVTAEKRGMRRPSIDRRDSSAGYTRANVVLCLVAVNYMKNDWPEDEFMALLLEIAG